MKISVILPCYNAAHYLEECLDSLLAQTMGDFEVLLVDDGSKDDTLSVAQKYAARDARIQVLHQDNAGVSAARNRPLGQEIFAQPRGNVGGGALHYFAGSLRHELFEMAYFV